MTKKQTEEMERLARELYGDYGDEEPNTKCFKDGYKAAQSPDQLIFNEHVKALVESCEKIKRNIVDFDAGHRINGKMTSSQKSIANFEKALKPFQDIGELNE